MAFQLKLIGEDVPLLTFDINPEDNPDLPKSLKRLVEPYTTEDKKKLAEQLEAEAKRMASEIVEDQGSQYKLGILLGPVKLPWPEGATIPNVLVVAMFNRHWSDQTWITTDSSGGHGNIRMVQFWEDCRYICRVLGTPPPGGIYSELSYRVDGPFKNVGRFEDRFLVIESDAGTEALHIRRLKVPEASDPSMRDCDNPMIMIKANGHCYRTHGEANHYLDYARGLASMLQGMQIAPETASL